MKIQLPKKYFMLMGTPIRVEYDPKLQEVHGDLGHAYYGDLKIVLQPSTKDYPVPDSIMEHTYIHEMVHQILHAMGEKQLKKNEKFVDLFSGLLHQAITSAR